MAVLARAMAGHSSHRGAAAPLHCEPNGNTQKKSATLVALGFHFVSGDVHGTDNHPYLQMRLQGWRLPVFNGDIQAGLG